jgi:hypothetical protein
MGAKRQGRLKIDLIDRGLFKRSQDHDSSL